MVVLTQMTSESWTVGDMLQFMKPKQGAKKGSVELDEHCLWMCHCCHHHIMDLAYPLCCQQWEKWVKENIKHVLHFDLFWAVTATVLGKGASFNLYITALIISEFLCCLLSQQGLGNNTIIRYPTSFVTKKKICSAYRPIIKYNLFNA